MIRIGVIGYGYWGPNLVRNCFEAKGARVECVSDLRDDRLASVSSRYPTIRTTRDCRELINDPTIDAVAIATPVSTHYELALQALQEGKHVLVEKPLASDTNQVQHLIEVGRIYGPYVNHNHYAGLMEMLVPIPLVISLSRLVPEKTRISAGVAAAIMVGTIFLSGSRGGMLSVFAELAVLATILFRQKRSLRIAMGLVAFSVVLISLLVWLGGKELTTSVGSISTEARGEISGGVRLSIAKDGIRMFTHRPILGWGLGAFPVVYPQFRSFPTNFVVNEAHNDYVQLLSEMGVIGFGVMLWFLFLVLLQAQRKVGNWTTHVSGAVTLACILGTIGILLHSLVDFNLQIPANAALFYVFCSIAAAPPLLQRSRKPKPAPTRDEELFPASEVV